MRRTSEPLASRLGARATFLFEARLVIPLVVGIGLAVDGLAMVAGALGAVAGYLVLLAGGLLLLLIAGLVYVFLGEWAVPAGLALSGVVFLVSDSVLAALRPRALAPGVAVALLGAVVLVLAVRRIAGRRVASPGG